MVYRNKSHHNTNGAASVAYCFTQINGFSKFGLYKGNGNANGSYIYCGFRPKWLMVKMWDSTEDWFVKSPVVDYGQLANDGELKRTLKFSDNTSSTNCTVSITATGFRPTTTDGKANGDGNVYLYMAFADHPIVGSNGTIALAI